MGSYNEQDIETHTEAHKQVYGIHEASVKTEADGTEVLSGLVYGHPMFKDGEKIVVGSSKINHWKIGDDEYFETAEGVTYRTF